MGLDQPVSIVGIIRMLLGFNNNSTKNSTGLTNILLASLASMITLVLDIETTGVSRTEHVITVIGTIVYESVEEKCISEKCYNVALAETSENPEDLVSMKKEISKLFDDADCIVAFNGINFDMPFICKWLKTTTLSTAISLDVDTQLKCESTDGEPAFAPVKRKLQQQSALPTDTMTILLCQKSNSDASNSIDSSVVKLDRWKHKYLDFCRLSRDYTGSYISLYNACLLNKIDFAKSGSGLQAVQWAKEKNWAMLESYCMQDVVVLLALTKHAVRSGITLRLRAYGKRGKEGETIVLCLDDRMQPFLPAVANAQRDVVDIFDTSSPNALHYDK